MSKQTAAVAVKGGSGVDSSSPPANVINLLWKEVEDKLLLQKGKACLEIKHIHIFLCMSSYNDAFINFIIGATFGVNPTRTTFSNSIINKI